MNCGPTYKFFGPHLGTLYGRYQLLDRLQAYKVRPAEDVPPHKFETGTKNHEGLAGTTAAIRAYERPVLARLIAGLLEIHGVTPYDITGPGPLRLARTDHRLHLGGIYTAPGGRAVGL